ncbi:MAG: TonB-dependent receptor [Sphingomonadaceae bacterium]|nr:TonB-dependent receptor [Sphingomonadaceae bacterium]
MRESPMILLALAAAASAAAPARAEDSIVVTASRTGEDVEASGGSVVEREAIERLQPVSLVEAIDREPGLRAFTKGGIGGGTYIGLRGAEPNFTSVLIEGARVNDPTNSQGGAFDLVQLDPGTVEAIEIVRGGYSAIHGSDALAGVINLRLRRPAPREFAGEIGGQIDSEGAAGLRGLVSAGIGEGGLLASAGWFDSGDLGIASDLKRFQLLARATRSLEGYALGLTALRADTARSGFPEDSGGPRLAASPERETRDTDLTLLALDIGRAAPAPVAPRLLINWSRQDSLIDTPAIAPGVLDGVPALLTDNRFDRFEAVGDVGVSLGSLLSLVAGAGYLREEGDSAGTIDIGFPLPTDFSLAREVRSAFAEASLRPAERLSLSAGARFDDASTNPGEWTGRTAISAQPWADGPIIFASIGEGYKLPSLFALAFPLIANPDLLPERSRSIEAGARMPIGARGYVQLALFDTRYTDLIDFDPERFTNVNRARVDTRGFEIDADLELAPPLGLRGILSYLDVDVPPGTPPLRSRPRWQAGLGLDWRPAASLTLGLDGRYVGPEFDSSVPTGLIRREGRAVIDASARWQASERINVTLALRNLLDADYEEAVGFRATGTVARLAVSAGF